MKEEGIGGISIRKIAEKIEYSPAIVYHYFKDKEDIINQIVISTYQSMTRELAHSQSASDKAEEKLKQGVKQYIELMTEMPEEFKTIMLSESPVILKHTSVLFKGASEARPAMGMLHRSLRDFYHEQGTNVGESRIELTAQVIWTALYGLVLRIITEKVEKDQKKRLIEGFLEFMINALQSGQTQTS